MISHTSPPNNRLEAAIRPARQSDTPGVLELTRHIWEGEDYVPQVWQAWLADPNGRLVVAEHQEQLIGLAKLSRLSAGDWWLHGLRVHPDFEGRGVASQLHDALLAHWQQVGSGALRLATSAQRLAVHHLCERSGFQRVCEFSSYSAPSLREAGPGMQGHMSGRQGEASDFQALEPEESHAAAEFARSESAKPVMELAGGLMDLGWEFAHPAAVHIEAAAQRGWAFWWQPAGMGRQGLLVFRLDQDHADDPWAPYVQLLACPLERLLDFLLDFRHLGGLLGYEQVGWLAPLRPQLPPVLKQAGFKRDWDGSIYVYAIEQRSEQNL